MGLNPKLANLFQSITSLTTKHLIICGDYFIQRMIRKINNMFWKDVLNSWVLFQQKFTFVNEEDILSLNIWNNNDILINRKPVIYKNYFERGVIFLYDLLDSQGRFMDYDTFSTKYNIHYIFLNIHL